MPPSLGNYTLVMHAPTNRLKRDLDMDVAIVDRQNITCWLMAFSAGTLLELEHPRLGSIRYLGVGFQGSPALVFDQYVGHVIEDLVERHLVALEAALAIVPRGERAQVVEDGCEELQKARMKLSTRAADIKGRLLGNGFNPVPVPLHGAGVAPVPIVQRLAAELKALQHMEFQNMKVSSATLDRLADAVAAMRAATDGAFAHRARRLSTLLAQNELAPARDELIGAVDFDAFLAKAQSDDVELGEALPLPDDPIKELGVVIGLIDYLAKDEGQALDLAFCHYGVGSINVDAWRNLVDQVIIPWHRDFVGYLQTQGKVEAKSATTNYLDLRHATGIIAIQQGTTNSSQTVNGDHTGSDIGTALEALVGVLAEFNLPEPVRGDVEGDIDTIQAQLKKRSPSHSILVEAGKSLRAIVENVAATAVTPPALAATAAILWQSLGLGS